MYEDCGPDGRQNNQCKFTLYHSFGYTEINIFVYEKSRKTQMKGSRRGQRKCYDRSYGYKLDLNEIHTNRYTTLNWLAREIPFGF